MHPILFKIGSLPIHTYGLLMAVGFLTALQVAKRLSIAAKINPEKILDLAFWCLLVGLLGARTLFVMTQLDEYIARPLAFFEIWNGGLVFFGGPLLAFPFAVWYLKRQRISPWLASDVMMPGLVIAHVFGRLGCVAAGCCYGRPTGSDFGLKFYSDLVEPALRGIPLHPTQLYEASALLILFFGLLFIFKHRAFDGQVGLTYFIAYPIIRSIVEVFRGDEVRGFVIPEILSTSQFISLLIFIAAALMLWFRLATVRKLSAK